MSTDNLFGLHQFDNATSFYNGDLPFGQGVGWAVVIGFGAFFAGLSTLLVWLDERSGGKYNSEDFNTAGRSIKTGLLATDVIAHWTWVSDLLQSTYETYNYGISGAFWYGASSVTQILLFGVTAMQMKKAAPACHTWIELVRKRWGHLAALVFLYMGVLCQAFVVAINLLGAAQSITATTGMNIYAAIMGIAIGIIFYCTVGGLKSTFTTSYIHTVVIFISLCGFMFLVFDSDIYPLGSIEKVYNNVNTEGDAFPVVGNRDGQYLTFFSLQGFEFGVLSTLSSFANVWLDQSYWQSAIASTPGSVAGGYLVGGIIWFIIPMSITASLGLAALAASLPISAEEAANGLLPVATAQFLLGKSGVVLILSIIFMAVTSACSSEFIALSSLWTYDIYKVYIRKKASGAEMLLASRVAVCVIGVVLGGFTCFLQAVGISINFIYLVVGLITAPGFPPVLMMLLWPKVGKWAAIFGALGGQALAILAWLVHTKISYGAITLDTCQTNGPVMTGTVVAVLMAFLILTLWTLLFPDRTGSYENFQGIELSEDLKIRDYYSEDPDRYTWQFKAVIIFSGILSIIFLFVWPLLTLPAGVWNLGYFTFYVILIWIWTFVGTFVVVFYPIYESRGSLVAIFLGKPLDQEGMMENSVHKPSLELLEEVRVDPTMATK